MTLERLAPSGSDESAELGAIGARTVVELYNRSSNSELLQRLPVSNEPVKRVAVVTGGCGGIGAAIAEALKAQGAEVVSVDVDGTPTITADLSGPQANRDMVSEVLRRFGRLDTLILNAGRQVVASLPEFPQAEWDSLLGLMLTGPFAAIQAAWPQLTARRGGRIVVIGSASSFVGEEFKAAYVSAKHGVLGLVRVAALEGARFGLTANLIAPGVVRTKMVERQLARQEEIRNQGREEILEQWLAAHAERRFIEPVEIAETVAFLAGPGSSAITGACLPVDLGAHARL